ncbi:invasion associated locus B family protein [Ensifer sp.]|uniref:invasion associated locus B family protein n=1 Tax=Ensifer sp. TaxID=1872086 RepID=UPI002E0DC7DF|nr:invasion associated locus B family protein [Ensifer sp.]
MTSRNAKPVLFGLTAVALLSLAAPLAAQNSTAPLFSTPAERSTTGAPILIDPTADGNGAIIGAPAGRANTRPAAEQKAKPAEPQKAAANRFKQWELQCVELDKQPVRCQISSSTLSPDGKQAILVLSLAYRPDGKSVAMQMAVPLGIALKDGVKLKVKDGYGATMAVSRCTPQGCLIEGPAEQALIDSMAAKAEATVTVMTPEGKAIPIALSLSGFADAQAALSARLPAPKPAN